MANYAEDNAPPAILDVYKNCYCATILNFKLLFIIEWVGAVVYIAFYTWVYITQAS